MKSNPKLTKLAKLDEKELREHVLIPLLGRLGYKGIVLYHGPRERGKDIICYDFDRLGLREFIAVVAKATDLDGSVSSSDSLRQTVFQIEQCFDVPYEDLYGMTTVTMNKVLVVTSKRIVPGAEDSVSNHLAKRNLSKLVRFISGEQLIQLIDEHFPSYWDAALDPVDVVQTQKNRLTRFCRRLLVSLHGDTPNVDATIQQVINSDFPPRISAPPDRSLSGVTAYSVDVDMIAPKYAHPFHSEECGEIKAAFFDAKAELYHAMFEIDETIWEYEEVIKKTDPWEFVSAFDKNLSERHPFWKASWGAASDAISKIEYLRSGLYDFDRLAEALQRTGKFEWASTLVASVNELEPEISSYLDGVDRAEFTLYWSIETVQNRGRLRLLYAPPATESTEVFKTEHKSEQQYHEYRVKRTRRTQSSDIISDVQHRLRIYINSLLTQLGVTLDE